MSPVLVVGAFVVGLARSVGSDPLAAGMAILCIAILTSIYTGSKNLKWVVANGELRLYNILGQFKAYPLKELRRLSREVESSSDGDSRQQWLLIFDSGLELLAVPPTWCEQFLGALVREAPSVEILDYTGLGIANRSSAIVM